MEGVGRSPGADGCMVGGCMGLRAPCENINETEQRSRSVIRGGREDLKHRAGHEVYASCFNYVTPNVVF